jgi:hypothetical protein
MKRNWKRFWLDLALFSLGSLAGGYVWRTQGKAAFLAFIIWFAAYTFVTALLACTDRE